MTTTSKKAQAVAARKALGGIDLKNPFIYAVVGVSSVVCMQPSADKTIDDIQEMIEAAKALRGSLWYYYSSKRKEIERTNHESVILSLELYIERRMKRKGML